MPGSCLAKGPQLRRELDCGELSLLERLAWNHEGIGPNTVYANPGREDVCLLCWSWPRAGNSRMNFVPDSIFVLACLSARPFAIIERRDATISGAPGRPVWPAPRLSANRHRLADWPNRARQARQELLLKRERGA